MSNTELTDLTEDLNLFNKSDIISLRVTPAVDSQ